MKTAIAVIAALVLAGCELRDDVPATIKPADKDNRDLTRWGPDEYGVVCYRQTGMEGISCVKVRPPVQACWTPTWAAARPASPACAEVFPSSASRSTRCISRPP